MRQCCVLMCMFTCMCLHVHFHTCACVCVCVCLATQPWMFWDRVSALATPQLHSFKEIAPLKVVLPRCLFSPHLLAGLGKPLRLLVLSLVQPSAFPHSCLFILTPPPSRFQPTAPCAHSNVRPGLSLGTQKGNKLGKVPYPAHSSGGISGSPHRLCPGQPC